MIDTKRVEILIETHEKAAKNLKQMVGFPLCETTGYLKRITAWLKSSNDNVDEFLSNVDQGKVGPNGMISQSWADFFASLGDHSTVEKLKKLKIKAPTEAMKRKVESLRGELIRSVHQKELTPRLAPHMEEWNSYQVLIAGYGNRAKRKKLSGIIKRLNEIGSAQYQRGELIYLHESRKKIVEKRTLRADQIVVLISSIREQLEELKTKHRDMNLAKEIETANLKGVHLVKQLINYREEVHFIEKIREKLNSEVNQRDWPFFKKHSKDGWKHIIGHIRTGYQDHKTADYFEKYCAKKGILDTIKGLNIVVGWVTTERRKKEMMDGAIQLVEDKLSHKEAVLEKEKLHLIEKVYHMSVERVHEIEKQKGQGYKMCIRTVDNRRKAIEKRMKSVVQEHQNLMDELYFKLAQGELQAQEMQKEWNLIRSVFKEKIPYYNANKTILHNMVSIAKSKYAWNLKTIVWTKGALNSVVENQKHLMKDNKIARKYAEMHDKLSKKTERQVKPVLEALRKLEHFRKQKLLTKVNLGTA